MAPTVGSSRDSQQRSLYIAVFYAHPRLLHRPSLTSLPTLLALLLYGPLYTLPYQAYLLWEATRTVAPETTRQALFERCHARCFTQSVCVFIVALMLPQLPWLDRNGEIALVVTLGLFTVLFSLCHAQAVLLVDARQALNEERAASEYVRQVALDERTLRLVELVGLGETRYQLTALEKLDQYIVAPHLCIPYLLVDARDHAL